MKTSKMEIENSKIYDGFSSLNEVQILKIKGGKELKIKNGSSCYVNQATCSYCGNDSCIPNTNCAIC